MTKETEVIIKESSHIVESSVSSSVNIVPASSVNIPIYRVDLSVALRHFPTDRLKNK